MMRLAPHDNKLSVSRFGLRRNNHGNMIVLIVAVTAAALFLILFFCFKMTRILGGYAEQRTAIEAAALAAANDLSQIVVDVTSPNIGWVGLSDAAPTGSHTLAPDGYALPVQSINTLLATVRLDLVVADQLGDPIMQQRAAEDYANVTAARAILVQHLRAAAAGGSSEVDLNGNQLNVVQDAIKAYNSNAQRMTGASKTFLVPGSLKLTLGCIPNAGSVLSASDTPVPQPTGVADVAANQQQDGYYIAFTDIPYASSGGNTDFVFAGLGSSVMLVDPHSFSTTAPGLSSQALLIPSVVKVDAQQQFVDADQHGKSLNRVVNITSCAQCSCNFDPRPHPGALVMSFPNGTPPEVVEMMSVYNDPKHAINWAPLDEFQVASGNGDYPEYALSDPLSTSLSPSYWAGYHPLIARPISLALYDWIKRAGCTLSIQGLTSFFNTPSITPSIPPPGLLNPGTTYPSASTCINHIRI